MPEAKKGIFGRLIEGASSLAEPDKGPIPVRSINAPAYAGVSGPYPFPARIKFKGVFDLDGLYKFMVSWLKKFKYEFHETLYKFKPPELEIRWLAERRKTGFAKDILHVHFHMWGEYDIEVIRNGKKKKMTNARMIITLNAEVEAPYTNLFGQRRWNLPMERRLLSIFHNYVIKREFELLYLDVLYYEMYAFHTAIKQYMRLSMSGNQY